MHRVWSALLVSGIALFVHVEQAAAQDSGSVIEVSAAARTITINPSIHHSREVFRVADDVTILIDGRLANLDELQPGYAVTIDYDINPSRWSNSKTQVRTLTATRPPRTGVAPGLQYSQGDALLAKVLTRHFAAGRRSTADADRVVGGLVRMSGLVAAHRHSQWLDRRDWAGTPVVTAWSERERDRLIAGALDHLLPGATPEGRVQIVTAVCRMADRQASWKEPVAGLLGFDMEAGRSTRLDRLRAELPEDQRYLADVVDLVERSEYKSAEREKKGA